MRLCKHGFYDRPCADIRVRHGLYSLIQPGLGVSLCGVFYNVRIYPCSAASIWSANAIRNHCATTPAASTIQFQLMDFILVTPDTLRSHWGAIRDALETVQDKAPADWIPEDVYHEIKAGNVACHVIV